MNNLQDTQKEALANYQAITETWDSEQALEILQRHNWDVTQASNYFFTSLSNNTNPYISENSFSQSSSSSSSSSPPSNSSFSQNPSAWGKNISSFFSVIWKSIVPEMIRGEISLPAQDFSKKMTENCRFPVDFSNLKFQELLTYCYDIEKPLLIYLHAYSYDYPQELFNDDELVSFMNNEYVYWGIDSSSDEGQMLKRLLDVDLLPFFAVIHVKDPKKPLVQTKHSGVLDKNQLLEILENYTKNADYELLQERKIRRQQQEEFKEAERVMIAKEREDMEKREQERQIKETRKRQKEERMEYLSKSVGPEPEYNPDTVLVSFRLSSGKRIDRNFDRNKKIAQLYEYLEMASIETTEIVFGFPSKTLLDKEKTLQEEGLHPKCLIHVRESNYF